MTKKKWVTTLLAGIVVAGVGVYTCIDATNLAMDGFQVVETYYGTKPTLNRFLSGVFSLSLGVFFILKVFVYLVLPTKLYEYLNKDVWDVFLGEVKNSNF